MTVQLVPDVESIEFVARIDPDSQTPALSIRVGLSDYFSQATSIQVLYWFVNGRQTWVQIHRDPLTGGFSSDIALSPYAVSGAYAIRSIMAIDDQGTLVQFSQAQLVELGFDMDVELINPNSDNTAPEVGSLSIGAVGFDTTGGLHIPIQVTASDIGSGLERHFILELFSPSGASLQQWGQFDADGNAQIDFWLSRFSSSGTYRVNTIRMTDEAGNQQMSFDYLAANPRSIEIANPLGDGVAPILKTFKPVAIYDPVTHRPIIVLKGSVFEQGSGVSGVYVRMLSPTGVVTDAPWLPYERVGSKKYSFSGNKALSTEFTPGEYAVNFVLLRDVAGNEVRIEPSATDDRAIKDFVRVYFPTTAGQRQVGGSSGSDFVFGTDLENDTLDGGLGDDTLYGGAGEDVVDGGDGDDELVGGDGAGNDLYLGGSGMDTVRYTSAVSGITVDLTAGVASGLDIGQDTLSGIEQLIGGQGDDRLTGDDQANSISGYLGEDTLVGLSGNDTLAGGTGADTVVFQGRRQEYQVTYLPNNRVTVSDMVTGRDGTDTLESVEFLSFADQVLPARPELSGIAYHWKNHALLRDVSLQLSSAASLPPGSAKLEIRDMRLDVATGICVAEVWVTDTSAVIDIGMSISAAGAVGAEFVATTPAGWQFAINTAQSQNIVVAGFDPAQSGVAGPFRLGSLTLTYGVPRDSIQLDVTQIEVNGLAVEDVSVSVGQLSTSGSGAFVSPVASGDLRIEAGAGPSNMASAVTAADALAALRIAVGINPNIRSDSGTAESALRVSPYQIMAADVDGSGKVTSADALSILKMAVGLPAAPQGEWLYVEETRDFWDEASGRFTLTRSDARWERLIEANIQTSGELNLVGVLKGDVNGSWQAPAGSIDLDTLDPNYFTNLATRLGVMNGASPITDQWGV